MSDFWFWVVLVLMLLTSGGIGAIFGNDKRK